MFKTDYTAELDTHISLQEKIQWLIDHEYNETGEAMDGLSTFLSYTCNDEYEQKVLELVSPVILKTYDICKGEYDLEQEAEEDDEQRAEEVAKLIVSSMIGAGLIGMEDTYHQQEWINKIKRTVENFG